MKIRRLIPRIAVLVVLGTAGCCHTQVQMSDRVIALDQTVPTCSSCTLTWSPNPTTAAGTVLSMPGTYTSASIMVDPNLLTAHEYPITVPTNNQWFSRLLTPVPRTKPSTAVLYLYYQYGNTLLRHTVSGFTVH
jgi:hypothetical protein